jgi:hypothetical protein
MSSTARSPEVYAVLPAFLRSLYPELPYAQTAASSQQALESLDHVRLAGEDWQRSITKEVLVLSEERSQPLARVREAKLPSKADADTYIDAAAAGGDAAPTTAAAAAANTSSRGFLFDSSDLLSAVSKIRCPQRTSFLRRIGADWGLMQLQLRTPPLEQLQRDYAELAPRHRQAGLDDVQPFPGADKFGEECRAACVRVLDNYTAAASVTTDSTGTDSNGSSSSAVAAARQCAKRGLPPSLRPKMWRLMLGLQPETTSSEVLHFMQLQDEVSLQRLYIDCSC